MSDESRDNNVFSRFKEERRRLGLDQQAVADVCQVTTKTISRWESSVPIPSDKLALLVPRGFDPDYVLTGELSLYRVVMQQVSELMEKESLEPEDLALEIGAKPKLIREALAGRMPLSIDVLLKIIERFQLSADWLLRGAGRMYHDPRTGVHLSPDEKALVDNYNNAPPEIQAAVDSILAAYSKNKK